MSFIARELVLKLSPQPLQMQRICEACDTTAAAPGCPAPSAFQVQPVCKICDTTAGLPEPECPAPSGMFLGNAPEAGPLTALRLQLQAKLSQN